MKQTRKDRREQRRAMAAQITPPEGVPLVLPVAGVGVRLGAQITDVLITFAFMIALIIVLALTSLFSFDFLFGLSAVFFFFIRVPYYILAELAWNGQTLGKKLMKIKVISHTGGPLTTHALVVRNMMKEAEVFLPATLLLTLNQEAPIASLLNLVWFTVVMIIPLSNPYRMRLGDMIADTHVVMMPQPLLLPDIAQRQSFEPIKPQEEFQFLSHQLDHYGRFELQTLETYLRELKSVRDGKTEKTLAAIVDRIRNKIGYADNVPEPRHRAFLQAFYKAQRAHLEQRQLFGERRADKNYNVEDTDKAS